MCTDSFETYHSSIKNGIVAMKVDNQDISDLLERRRFILIGAGQLGEMSLATWPLNVPRPEYILDSHKLGRLMGIEIQDLATHIPQVDVTYLLSAFKMPVSEVRSIFSHIGQSKILTVYDLFEYYSPELFSNGWSNYSDQCNIDQLIEQQGNLFSDDMSKSVIRAVILWRYKRELVDNYPVMAEMSKYDLANYGLSFKHYDKIYDCGAYDMGLIENLSLAGVTFSDYWAFEPDPENFIKCQERISQLPMKLKSSILLDSRAIYDCESLLPFWANGHLSARVLSKMSSSKVNIINVKSCKLDDVNLKIESDFHSYSHSKTILLKLHIEGAEPVAIIHAKRIITDNHTDIIINLSHDENSLIEIPRFLSTFGKYDLFLRSHSLFGEGLTLVARDRSRTQ